MNTSIFFLPLNDWLILRFPIVYKLLRLCTYSKNFLFLLGSCNEMFTKVPDQIVCRYEGTLLRWKPILTSVMGKRPLCIEYPNSKISRIPAYRLCDRICLTSPQPHPREFCGPILSWRAIFASDARGLHFSDRGFIEWEPVIYVTPRPLPPPPPISFKKITFYFETKLNILNSLQW